MLCEKPFQHLQIAFIHSEFALRACYSCPFGFLHVIFALELIVVEVLPFLFFFLASATISPISISVLIYSLVHYLIGAGKIVVAVEDKKIKTKQPFNFNAQLYLNVVYNYAQFNSQYGGENKMLEQKIIFLIV